MISRFFAGSVVVSILAGCSGAQVAPNGERTTWSALSVSDAGRAVDDSKKPTLYYSDVNANLVGIIDGDTYKVLGTIREFSHVGGVATDRVGNLYVADNGASQILVFHARQSKPYKSLSVPTSPYRVRVANDGTVAAPGPCCSSGIIYYYKKGATSPTGTLVVPDGPNLTGLAFDARGNLYVGALTSNNNGTIQKFLAPYKAEPSPLPAQVSQPYSESFDAHGHIAVADFASDVKVFAPKDSKPLSEFDSGSNPFEAIFSTDHERIFVGRNNPQKGVDVYAYPSETYLTTILLYPSAHVDDLAFGPAASP